jgi:putative hydrolase of the HAD superfamily
MLIKNIIFDLGGVLVGLDDQRCIDAFKAIGAPQIAQYIEDHRTEDLFYDTEVGNISQHEFCNEVRRIASCNVRDEDIVWAWNRLLTVIPNEKKVRLLELHDKGFRLFLLSNTNEMHWNYCAEELFPYKRWIAQDFFDEIYLSYELHKIKPQEDIFATVLADAGIKAEETLFIDDNEANIAAARELGIHTFWNEHPDDWLKI